MGPRLSVMSRPRAVWVPGPDARASGAGGYPRPARRKLLTKRWTRRGRNSALFRFLEVEGGHR